MTARTMCESYRQAPATSTGERCAAGRLEQQATLAQWWSREKEMTGWEAVRIARVKLLVKLLVDHAIAQLLGLVLESLGRQ